MKMKVTVGAILAPSFTVELLLLFGLAWLGEVTLIVLLRMGRESRHEAKTAHGIVSTLSNWAKAMVGARQVFHEFLAAFDSCKHLLWSKTYSDVHFATSACWELRNQFQFMEVANMMQDDKAVVIIDAAWIAPHGTMIYDEHMDLTSQLSTLLERSPWWSWCPRSWNISSAQKKHAPWNSTSWNGCDSYR